MANAIQPPYAEVYIPEVDLEDFEEYSVGGYHPTVIGATFCGGRYEVVHKLGFGGYSTIWLAKDKQLQRYVSLKILIAYEFSKSTEAKILRRVHGDESSHPGPRFIPRLLDEFSINSPNGHHVCLVQEPAVCSIAASKEACADFMFPVETARSIAAQLIMGLSDLHSQGVCHGGRSNPNHVSVPTCP
jgi:serine/threonine protein kinase